MLVLMPPSGEIYDLLIGQPAETAKHKQLPLISPHANVLDCLVDDFGLA